MDIELHDFEDGIHDLILVSLVIPEQYKDEQSNIASRYALLSLTRGYVRKQLDKEFILKRDIEERIRTVHSTIEEAERATRQYRYSLSNLGAITEEEKIAAMIAQTAFQKYSAGRYVDAVEDYKHSTKIAPTFASLYRNWAVMEAQERHNIEADELMKKAARLNPNDPQIWLAWGNIKRKGDKIKEALEYYEKAYNLSPEDRAVLNALGQARCRLGDYAKADELFRRALEKEAEGSSVRHDIINCSSLADNLLHWAENLRRDRNYREAEVKLKEALAYGDYVVKLDRNDVKSSDLLRKTLIELGHFYKETQPRVAVTYFEKAMVDKPIRYTEAKDKIEAGLQAAKLFYQLGDFEKAKQILTPELAKIREPLKRNYRLQEEFYTLYQELNHRQSAIKGTIIKVNFERSFTIIESTTSLGSTYLGHFKDFVPKLDHFSQALEGRTVNFIPREVQMDTGLKKTARFIKIASENEPIV